MANSGHSACERQCPLSGVKRTFLTTQLMSAYDPKRTFRVSLITSVSTRPCVFVGLKTGLFAYCDDRSGKIRLLQVGPGRRIERVVRDQRGNLVRVCRDHEVAPASYFDMTVIWY